MKHRNDAGFSPVKVAVFLIILLCNCDKQDQQDKIAVGNNYEGGIIFYIDNTGQHGLIAAPRDQGSFQWGCVTAIISGADGKVVGTGNQNSTEIVAGCPDTDAAAYTCMNLVLNGYSDWYLPSIDELNLMYQNLHTKGLGEFKSQFCLFDCWDAYYWSSTQYDTICAWNINFKRGTQSHPSKNNAYVVRAIRVF